VKGRVKWFEPKKGWGFIEAEDGSGDVFVHFGDIEGEGEPRLEAGDAVEFEVNETPQGKRAVHVRRGG